MRCLTIQRLNVLLLEDSRFAFFFFFFYLSRFADDMEQIGLAHGHQVVPWGDKESLAMMRRKLDCDVLISGHTHKFEAYGYQGGFYLNPGSATGAYSASSGASVPTFVLMDVDDNTITSYVYRLQEGEVQVEKIEYTKGQ